jgi:hypothetical protein
MKRSLTLACMLMVIAGALAAQPVLRVSTLPAPIVEFTMHVCDTAGVTPGPGGAGVTWDFSSLKRRGSEETITRYLSRDLLPTEQQGLFPNAEVFVVDDTVTTGFRLIEDQWRWEGTNTPAATIVAGNDPYDTRPAEVVFNDPKSGTYDGIIERFPIPGATTRTGDHSFVYDGFGTLITPEAIITNSARTTETSTTRDEFSIGPQRVFLVLSTTTTTWFPFTRNTPHLVIQQIDGRVENVMGQPIGAPFTQKTVRYAKDGSTSSVDEELERSVTLLPQPVTAAVATIGGLPSAPTSVVIVDALGLIRQASYTSTGDSGIELDVRSLPSGRYAAVLTFGEGAGSRTVTRTFIRLK